MANLRAIALKTYLPLLFLRFRFLRILERIGRRLLWCFLYETTCECTRTSSWWRLAWTLGCCVAEHGTPCPELERWNIPAAIFEFSDGFIFAHRTVGTFRTRKHCRSVILKDRAGWQGVHCNEVRHGRRYNDDRRGSCFSRIFSFWE